MRYALSICFWLFLINLYGQTPINQIEGYTEVYHHEDSTSLYLGKLAGQQLQVPITGDKIK